MVDINTITQRENVFRPLTNRWDADKSRIYNVKYAVRYHKGKGYKEIPDIYNVQRGLAAKDYNKYMNKLIALTREIKVHSDDNTFDEGKIIQFCKDSDFAVDEYLTRKMCQVSSATHNAHICHRGWVTEAEFWREEDGVLIPDSRPLDPRWVTWDTDGEELEWAAVKTFRYPRDVNGEYGTEYADGDLLEVRDCWTRDSNYIYVKDIMIFEQPNPYGYVPFVIRAAPYGPILGDDDALEHRGESIFYPQRSAYDDANFNASIMKTMALRGVRPPLQTKGKAPKQYASEGDYIEGQEEPLEQVPIADLSNAQRNFQAITDADLQTNAFPRSDFGALTSQISGDALDILNRGGGEVINSRIMGLQEFYAAVYRMRIDQFVQIGKKFKIGRSRTHSASDLKDDYEISVKLLDKSLESWARRGAAGASLRGQLSRKDIAREIFYPEDPQKAEDMVDIEELIRRDPIIFEIDRTYDLIRDHTPESNVKAWAMAYQVKARLQQIAGGVPMQAEDSREQPIVNMRTRGVSSGQ